MISKENDKKLALELRKKGYSYSAIKSKIKVSKSTLSLWLREFPLSKKEIDLLRGKNPKRIELFRNTMRLKREREEDEVFEKVKLEIGDFSERETLIAGLFLYWGEGTKAAPCTVAVTNTDPDVLRFFVRWLKLLGVSVSSLKVVLHLYRDMNVINEIHFWSDYLKIPIPQFRKPYIKKTRLYDINYRSGFKHGTCSVLYLKKDLYLYVRSCLKFIRMRA